MMGTLFMGVISLTAVLGQTVQEGLEKLNGERINEAKEVFTKLAEASPTPENQYYLGYYYLRTDQLDEAQKAFEKGAQLDEKDYLNQVGLASVALGKGDRAKAQELIAVAEKKTKGKNAEVLFRAGEAYILFEKNNDPAEAIRLLDAAIKRDNSLADAYLAKGDALLLRNEGGPAVTAYEYALTAKPNYALANNRIGQVYLRGKNYNNALEYYKKAIEASPDFAPAYKDLAELYFMAQQYKRAAENFDLYLQKSGDTDPKMILRAAQFAFTADEYAKSLQFLESIKGKLDDPITKRMYGWAYFKTNDMEQSISNLEEFIKIAPEKVIGDDYKFLGRAYNKMATDGEYDSTGMVYILKGAEMDTSVAEAAATYKEVANLYYKQKEYAQAAAAFDKGIKLDTVKASTNDYYLLGMAYFQQGTNTVVADSLTGADSTQLADVRKNLFVSSDSVFAIVTQKVPDWPYGHYWRASSLYNAYDRQENIDKGISAPHYEKLVEAVEKEGDMGKYKSYLRLAYNYLAYYNQTTLKDEEKAKMYWTKLLEIDPDNQNAKEALGMTQAAAAPVKGAVKKN
ncbi:hypothetical protein GCM10027275_45980 [Rhabdobacter roseus]